MNAITLGTCVRHIPPRHHERFIGSGVIYEVDLRRRTCSLVMLCGRIILDMPLVSLVDGTWFISARTMALQQVSHLLLHAREMSTWGQEQRLRTRLQRRAASMSLPVTLDITPLLPGQLRVDAFVAEHA